jgi:eukaryotic-like serine/threonine-protein kinase
MPLTLAPNAVIGGKYRLERLIGKGGMGEVWAASHTVTRHRVAIKFLSGDTTANDDARRRFFREARAACAVSHPNVVVIHDVIEVEEQTPAIVMELLQGESLESKIAREGTLSVETTLRLLLPVVSAVGTAHSLGVVHRDIKPDNIFLAETGDGTVVKVLDFGVAKLGNQENGGATAGLTSTGAMLGTPYYMSPEQAFGEKLVDHRADLWSLGIVMFRCLSGVLPTRAENIGQILKIIMTRSIPRLADVAPHVPEPICLLVTQLLGYSPSERPADLRPVKAVIEAALKVKGDDLAPAIIAASSLAGVATPSLPRDALKRSRAPIFALAGAVAFTAITAIVLLNTTPQAPRAITATAVSQPEEETLVTGALPASQAPLPVARSAPAVEVTPELSAAKPLPSGRLPKPSSAPTTSAASSAQPAPRPGSSLGPIVQNPGY